MGFMRECCGVNKMIKPKLKRIILNTNYFELGALRGALGDRFDKLPVKLKLKLNILFTQAYLDHPTLGKQAVRDIQKYREELKNVKTN